MDWLPTLLSFKNGQYMIYGGRADSTLHAPKAGDERLLLIVHDEPARDLFNQLGSVGERRVPLVSVVRERGDIYCEYSLRLGFYSCYFNFDLSTGKSFASSSVAPQRQ
jgi:hypothetical protein